MQKSSSIMQKSSSIMQKSSSIRPVWDGDSSTREFINILLPC